MVPKAKDKQIVLERLRTRHIIIPPRGGRETVRNGDLLKGKGRKKRSGVNDEARRENLRRALWCGALKTDHRIKNNSQHNDD